MAGKERVVFESRGRKMGRRRRRRRKKRRRELRGKRR